MDKIIGIVMLVPMLISGLVLTPINIDDPVFNEDICRNIEQKINQQVEDAAVMVYGQNCDQTVDSVVDPYKSKVSGDGYSVESGFVIDSESNSIFKATANSNAVLESEGYNSLSGVFVLCRSNDGDVRTKLNLDSSLVGYGSNVKSESFEFDFNFCRLGEERFLVSYSGLSLEKLFEVSNFWMDVESYGSVVRKPINNDESETFIEFESPYGMMRIEYRLSSDTGWPIVRPHLYELSPYIKTDYIYHSQLELNSDINYAAEAWKEKNNYPHDIPNLSWNGTIFRYGSATTSTGNREVSVPVRFWSSFAFQAPVNDCFIRDTSWGGIPNVTAYAFRNTEEGGCIWDYQSMYRTSSGDLSQYLPYFGMGFTTGFDEDSFFKSRVYTSPNDFPTNDGQTNVRYTILESDYFDELPMTNPEGGIDQDYADSVNICTNFSCIEEKYSYPESHYSEYIENIEIREYMDDFPPFPELPPYDGDPSTGTGITSGFWQLLSDLVGYAIDTFKYTISEFKDLVLNVLAIVMDSLRYIVDDFLEFGRWVVGMFVSADYDYEGLQLIVDDAFQNSSGTIGVESFKNVFTTITDDYSQRAETNSCKVFLPEVESGFFKGFSVDVCGISEGIDWSLYRGLLSFVIILAALMTSVKMIYKMITLGKNPAREIVGSD